MSQQMASNSTQQPTITSLTDGSVTAQAENSVVPPIGDQPPNEAMTTRKRKAPTKTSKAWKDFTEVIVGGIKKGKCSHCFTELAVTRGSTSSLLRHRLTCIPRKASISGKGQQHLLHFGADSGSSLSTYKFDKDMIKEVIAKMIMVHEYPFRMVEHECFLLLCKMLNPRFEVVKRKAIRQECIRVYGCEKAKLKLKLASVDRVSLTSDLWTSNQTVGYMCLTGHYMGSDWKLQKRILNFCRFPPPHTGVAIADAIHECLIEWGLETKISTITLDNASSNDKAISSLKTIFASNENLFFGGKIFHVRCCAHILNLMVQDGLKEIAGVIVNVRESVKYVTLTPSRLHKFNEIVKQLHLPIATSKSLPLDVSTRWNSTYAMLATAIEFKDVFVRYQDREPNYVWLPSDEDWERAEEVCKFLEIFDEVTLIFSGTSYPTSNQFLPEIWKIKELLNDMIFDEREYIRSMTKEMKDKFDKYWGECNLLMALAAVLDPRYKMVLINFCFPKIYAPDKLQKCKDEVKDALYDLFNDYVSKDAERNASSVASGSGVGASKVKTKSRNEFDTWARQLDMVQPNKSELDIYLEESIYLPGEEDADFDALTWWKANTLKFRHLSKLARDILSIPVTTVASESAFSAGGRVLDQYRSSLKADAVEALLCGGDWLRGDSGIEELFNVEEENNDD